MKTSLTTEQIVALQQQLPGCVVNGVLHRHMVICFEEACRLRNLTVPDLRTLTNVPNLQRIPIVNATGSV